MRIIRTDAMNKDFQRLVTLLDLDLKERDGDDHPFFAQFNKLDSIRHVILCYHNELAVGCGAFREYAKEKAEIKRMFVLPEYRGHGYATSILSSLELWAKESGYDICILETGLKQPEAIGLYRKCGYTTIPNYSPYETINSSVCMQKIL